MAEESQKTFFSYARVDSEFVLRLVKDLRGAGADVWLDQLDIGPGERWDSAVENALRICPRHVTVLSPAAVSSQNVMDEVSYALEEHKQVIPLLFRDCAIPFRLRRLQWVDFRSDYSTGCKNLLAALGIKEQQEVPALPAQIQPPSVEAPGRSATDDAEEFFQRGLTCFTESDWDKAISEFDKVIQLRPDPVALCYRGSSYRVKGKLDRAIQDYTQALALRKDYQDARVYRGLAYALKDEHDLAIKDFDEAIRLNPRSDMALSYRGWVYENKGLYAEALRDLNAALKLKPKDEFTLNRRREVRARLKE